MLYRKMLLIFLCFLSMGARAQSGWNYRSLNTITTDYNTCLIGVKDTAGNWVIPAIYERLNHGGYNQYVAYAGGRGGIIDSAGRIIIPLMYNYIYPCETTYGKAWYGCYSVSLNSGHGIIDANNIAVIPLEYPSLQLFSDSTALAGDGKGRWWVHRRFGNKTLLPWTSKDTPRHSLPHTYVFKRKKFFRIHRYGVMNDSGAVLLEREFDHITAYHATSVLAVTKKGKTGYYSATGKQYWPLIFDSREYYYSRHGYGWRLGQLEIAPMSVNGSYGLISVYGDTLLPFNYSRIEPFKTWGGNTLWTVDSAKYTGVFDQEKGWIIPLDTVIISSVTSWLDPVDSTSVGLILTGGRNHYGAMLTTGQIIVPFDNSDMYAQSNTEFIFAKGDSLLLLSVITPYDREFVEVNLFDGDDKRSVKWDGTYLVDRVNSARPLGRFEGKENVVAYYNPARTHDSLRTSRRTIAMTGNYAGGNLPDSVALSALLVVRPVRYEVIRGDSFTIYGIPSYHQSDTSRQSPELVLMKDNGITKLSAIERSYNEGPTELFITSHYDVLRKDGKVILNNDSLGYIDILRTDNNGEMYFSAYVPGGHAYYDTLGRRSGSVTKERYTDFGGNYAWVYGPKAYHYKLIDRRTGLSVLPSGMHCTSAHPIWDSLTILETNPHGYTLYNILQKKNLITGMNSIASLNTEGSVFAIRTCSGMIGLIDREGNKILDTIFTAMVPLGYRSSFLTSEDDFEDYDVTLIYDYWLFTGADTMIAYDVRQKTLLNSSATQQVIWDQSVIIGREHNKREFLVDSLTNYSDYRRQISIYLTRADSAALLPWQLRTLYDTVFAPISYNADDCYEWHRISCTYCRSMKVRSRCYEWYPHEETRPNFMIVHQSDSLFCFSQFYSQFTWRRSSLEYSYISNIMLFPEGPRELLIDSLFIPSSDWRNFLINTVLNYVNSHSSVRGDCHNPALIPVSLQKNFLITPYGLVLLPDGFSENGNQLRITVPWKDIDAMLRPDIKSRLPIHEKP